MEEETKKTADVSVSSSVSIKDCHAHVSTVEGSMAFLYTIQGHLAGRRPLTQMVSVQLKKREAEFKIVL